MIRILALALLAALGACTPPPAPIPSDAHDPPFARVPYEPISRASVVAVALREWRLFGAPVDDDPPDTRPPPPPDQKPEREEGLWQRVGEYWWLGMNAGSPEAAWTGEHERRATSFPPTSRRLRLVGRVCFVCDAYCRRRGAFPYSASHFTYINIAKQMATGQASNWVITAERPESYAPRPAT